jgi:uracil-DNA glycosylase
MQNVPPDAMVQSNKHTHAGNVDQMTEEGLDAAANKRLMLAALLDWYRAAGVDAAVSDDAVDWISRRGEAPPSAAMLIGDTLQAEQAPRCPSPPSPSTSRAPLTAPMSPQGATGALEPRSATESGSRSGQKAGPGTAANAAPEDVVREAREAAASAQSLAELGQHLEQFDGCGLKAMAKNLCFFRGAESARVMIIGEAPGRDEDRAGVPFVGRAGQLLDKMLAAIGLDDSTAHITNVVYWRPPGNRTPTPVETQVCRPFLDRQIELVSPDIIVTVGGPAAKTLLDTSAGIMKLRGKWHEISIAGKTVRVMPTLHPAYLLRTPAAKRLAWRDLLDIKAALQH